MDESKNTNTTLFIAISMVLGFLVGLGLNFTGTHEYAAYIKPLGTIFLRLLRMVIIPLVFSSVFMAVINLETVTNLSSIGKYAFFYYFATTSVAILLGIILVTVIAPGKSSAENDQMITPIQKMQSATTAPVQEEKPKELYQTIVEVIVTAVPKNPIQALAEGNMLQVIVFSLLFAIIALYHQSEAQGFISFASSLERISHYLTAAIMKVAPIGIFALIVNVMAELGTQALVYLGKYTIVVLLGLLIHTCLLIAFISMRIKMSPITFFKKIFTVMLTAFSTSSSSATLPVTMSTITQEFGVRKKTSNFILPLGATVNMDGTAIYVSISTIFIAQVYGIDLSFSQLFIIFVTGSLAAVGAAAVPGAGLITMGIVMGAVGIPLEGIQIVIAVERLLDMSRTVVNVTGDSIGAIFIDSIMQKRT